ncbi:hypothetical protein HON22_04690 [Candidatus Peregrinibacteria bacterium]|jgi:zinc and cadmium transporter|nr:hypothetical protein [Candidatus Peregrinibacteria bacterium]
MFAFISALAVNILISAVLAFVILAIHNIQDFLEKHQKILISFTVGALLALIFGDFIPELSETLAPDSLGISLLVGLLLFYFLELVLHWHHCADMEHQHCNHGYKTIHNEHGSLMFVGTFLHNLFHGMVIYSSFLISFETGLILSIGILVHALPQNIANYIMNHRNVKTTLLASLGGILGVLIAYPFASIIDTYKFYILALTVGGLLYLSLSDIIPSINGNMPTKERVKHFAFVMIGLLFIYSLQEFLAHSLGHIH